MNKVETKRAKLTRAAHDQAPSARPTKDQHGNNQKRHYATWRYFLRKAPPVDGNNPQEEERQKFYITAASDRLLPEAGGTVQAQQEQHIPYASFMARIRQTGVASADPLSLEYWGIPKGLASSISQQTGIKQLFEWQADCLSASPDVL